MTINEKQKVNKAMLGLANYMEKSAERIKRIAVKLKTNKYSSDYIENYLKGLGFKDLYLADRDYHLTTWKTWKKIIANDWIDKRKYRKDKYDCDNFAGSFNSMATELYGLNSVGIAKMTRLDKPSTDQRIGFHRHNLIIALDDNKVKAFLYEPMSDEFVEVKRNKPIVLGNWEYNMQLIEIY